MRLSLQLGVGLAIILLSGANPDSAHADTLVLDGGTPNDLLRFNAGVNYTYTTATTEIELTKQVQFNKFNWWGAYPAGGRASASDGFQLLVYAAANSSPTVPIAGASLGTGAPTLTGSAYPSGALEYQYTSTFPTLTLGPGEYFLGITHGGGTGGVWGWAQTSGGPQLGGGSYDQLGRFTAVSNENLAYQAFQVAPVPLPSSFYLMVTGAGMALLLGRRRLLL